MEGLYSILLRGNKKKIAGIVGKVPGEIADILITEDGEAKEVDISNNKAIKLITKFVWEIRDDDAWNSAFVLGIKDIEKGRWFTGEYEPANNLKQLAIVGLLRGFKSNSQAIQARTVLKTTSLVEKMKGKPLWDFDEKDQYDIYVRYSKAMISPRSLSTKISSINRLNDQVQKIFVANGSSLKHTERWTRHAVRETNGHYLKYDDLMDEIIWGNTYWNKPANESLQYTAIMLLLFKGVRCDSYENEMGDLTWEDINGYHIRIRGNYARNIKITPGEKTVLKNLIRRADNNHLFTPFKKVRQYDAKPLTHNTLNMRGVELAHALGETGDMYSFVRVRMAGKLHMAHELAMYNYGRVKKLRRNQRTEIARQVLINFGEITEEEAPKGFANYKTSGRGAYQKVNTFLAVWNQHDPLDEEERKEDRVELLKKEA